MPIYMPHVEPPYQPPDSTLYRADPIETLTGPDAQQPLARFKPREAERLLVTRWAPFRKAVRQRQQRERRREPDEAPAATLDMHDELDLDDLAPPPNPFKSLVEHQLHLHLDLDEAARRPPPR